MNEAAESEGRRGLSPTGLSLCFVAAAVLIFSRCPSLLLHWQFYAEDGRMWFQQAYNGGWLHSLTVPDGGYLNTLQRLITGLALLVSFRLAPLVQTFAGLLLQAAPVVVLLSARCATWGSLPARGLMAALYVAVPSSTELHVVLTDSQWHYALMEVLLAFANRPRTWVGRTGDCVLFGLGGFCGPFGLLLVPLLMVFWLVRRQGWSLILAALMAVGSSVQVWELAHNTQRHVGVLGATPAILVRMLGGDIFDCALLGQRGFAFALPLAVHAVTALALLGILAYCVVRAPLPFALLIAFCSLIVAGALHAPMIAGAGTQWDLMMHVKGSRYWALPILMLLWCLAWMAVDAPPMLNRRYPLALRYGAAALLVVGLIGIVHDWRVRALPPSHFAQDAARFEQAQPGEHVLIKEYPPDWTMDLVKHR